MYLPQDFFKEFGAAIVEACMGTKIFPSVKAAQMALETGYGKSKVANNMFGIKAKGPHTPYWKGSYIKADTTEVTQGNTVDISDYFRSYPTISDSIRDHTYFLQSNPRYKPVFEAATPEDQASALQAAGYATDPDYASKLISIIKKYGLKSLDKKKS